MSLPPEMFGFTVPSTFTLLIGKEKTPFIRNTQDYQKASFYFAALIREQAAEVEQITLSLPQLDLPFFEIIDLFVTKGEDKVWVMEEEKVKSLIPFLNLYGIKSLEQSAFSVLARYFTLENIVSKIREAQKKEWLDLEEKGLQFLNERDFGFILKIFSLKREHKGTLSLEVIRYGEDLFYYFNALLPLIKEFAFHYMASEDALFSELLKTAPSLLSLDLSRTLHFPHGIYKGTFSLEKLNVSENLWLDDSSLGELLFFYPTLKTLSLSGCPNLSFQGFSKLQQLTSLENLDLSRNTQLKEEDLFIILHALPSLKKLNLEGCLKLSSKAFLEIGRSLVSLNALNLSSCALEKGVLKNLCSSLKNLRTLHIQRIEGLKGKTIQESLALNTSLKKVVLSPLSLEEEQNLKLSYPLMEFEFL